MNLDLSPLWKAALLAAAVLALHDELLAARLDGWRRAQSEAVALTPTDE